jgi:hypothetical protein
MINKAPSNFTADEISIPSPLALIAATEKISIGIIKGNIMSEISTPESLEPRTNAAPTLPIRLIVGVPSNIVISSVEYESEFIFSIVAKTGEISSIGNPVVSQ